MLRKFILLWTVVGLLCGVVLPVSVANAQSVVATLAGRRIAEFDYAEVNGLASSEVEEILTQIFEGATWTIYVDESVVFENDSADDLYLEGTWAFEDEVLYLDLEVFDAYLYEEGGQTFLDIYFAFDSDGTSIEAVFYQSVTGTLVEPEPTAVPTATPAPRPTPTPTPAQTVNNDVDRDGIANSVDRCPNEPETVNGFADSDGCPDSLADLVATAEQDLNTFWQGIFTANELRYSAPELFTFSSSSQSLATPCGVTKRYDAFFCRLDNAIYIDLNFLDLLLNRTGDFAPVVIIAHEWGHSIQHQVGFWDQTDFTIQTELGADCLAGAYAQHANSVSRLLEPGDLEEGADNTYNFGDDLPWFAPTAHGSPDQREAAYYDGFNNGVGACWDY